MIIKLLLTQCNKHFLICCWFTVTPNSTFGLHGYDNNEMNMHPFFVAFGPQIKREYKLDPFDSVDLYSLFSYMLKLKAPHTNGTLDNVKSLLTSEPDPSLPYIRK